MECVNIPKMLFQEKQYEKLSVDAKLLYSLLLDRKTLANINGWIDQNGIAYVVYPKSEIKKHLNASRYHVDMALEELEKCGQMVVVTQPYPGRPCQIYVKDITGNHEKDMEENAMCMMMKDSNDKNKEPMMGPCMGIPGMHALASDMNRHPMFCDMQNMMESMMFGKEPENLLNEGFGQSGMGMYCLTNGDKMNGAGLILQGDLMQQIGEIVGGDFYILPSSCHEVLVIPESMGMDVKELSAMVQQVNETEVSTEDRLSDHVQHYDSKEAVMENAEKRVSRLEKEKAETKAAKKSIHDRLGEKKQQSAAKKAEKAVDKAVKKDKGQEL